MRSSHRRLVVVVGEDGYDGLKEVASDGWGGSGKTGTYCQLLPNSTSLKSLQRVLIMGTCACPYNWKRTTSIEFFC